MLSRIATFALFFLLAGLTMLGAKVPDAICEINLGAAAHNAVLDFAANLGACENKEIKICKECKPAFADCVIFGVPKSGNVLEKYIPKVTALKNDGYVIERESGRIYVLANTQEGIVNGAYALLRSFGVGLNLGTSFIPDLPSEPKSKVVSPALKIRGFLPWYNFLNSPTTWDYCDHRAFVDDAIRLGANFIGFHTYDSEPFAAFMGTDGNMKLGQRLLTTKARLWGTHPMKTEDFGFGISKLYDKHYYGNTSTSDIADSNQAILAEQGILRDAFDYAKSRGIKTCIGFEIRRNPLDEDEIKTFIRRLENLLISYPAADYIWLWQPEVWGATGFEHKEHKIGSYTNSLKFYSKDLRDVFSRIVNHKNIPAEFDRGGELGRQNRAMEGVRLAQYALVAHRVLRRFKNPPKLVISGWGGDRRLVSAEYYEGLDKLLPKDVVFSSLDLIGPVPRIDEIYNELPPDRERWPIPWLENDGDQWQPQPYVKIYSGLMDKLLSGGSQGVLGIHWRTRCIGENFRYLCERAWKPSLTLDEFYEDYAASLYGREYSAQLGEIHKNLDSLPYRWVGGDGQVECASFRWGDVGDEKFKEKLESIKGELSLFKPSNPYAGANLEWLTARINWVLAYRNMSVAANKVESLIAAKNYDEAMRLLEDSSFEEGFRAYVPRLSTRGEYGVLATVMTKAYYWWLENYKLCCKNSKLSPTNPHLKKWEFKNSRIILPRRYTSIESGSDLLLNPIVLGGGDAWVLYKSLGDKVWKSEKLKQLRGWVYEARIAKQQIGSRALLFAFSKKPSFDGEASVVNVVSVLPKHREQSREKIVGNLSIAKINLKSIKGENAPVKLSWDEVERADYYRVIRDSKIICSTAFNWISDAANKGECTYKIEAIRDSKVVALSDELNVAMPNTPISEKPEVKVESRNACGVLIELLPARDSAIAKLVIYRRGRPIDDAAKDRVFEHIKESKNYENFEKIAEVPLEPDGDIRFIDKVGFGDFEYKFAFANACDFESKNFTGIKLSHRPVERACALNLPLTRKPDCGNVIGDVKFTSDGADLSKGRIEIPFKSKFENGFALSLDFKPMEISGMPVVASNGTHLSSGWYVQILGGFIQVSLGSNINTNVRALPGKWYNLRLVYDGCIAKIYVNSELTNEVSLPRSIQNSRPDLKIGSYENVNEPSFKFKGFVRNLKIWESVPLDFN